MNGEVGRVDELLRRAVAAHAQGRLFEAEAICRSALNVDENSFDVHYLLGVLASAQSRHDVAARCFERAAAIKPDNASIQYQCGRALSAAHDFRRAVSSYLRAIVLRPDYPDAQLYLAQALRAVGLLEEAQDSYEQSLVGRRRLLARSPTDFAARCALATDFEQMGDIATALACCREALAINPDFVTARGAIANYQIPTIFEDVESVAKARQGFERELANLADWLDAEQPADGYTAFSTIRTFFLAYQEERNVDLLATYGELCARTMRRWQIGVTRPLPRRARDGKIRIGIVLANVIAGPVWNAIVRGWLDHIDRTRFDIYLFRLEPARDDQTDAAISLTRHVDLTATGLDESVDRILAAEVDVLLYPEIGMNRKAALLAGLRLARVQAATWGHPETTGLPTMDYFLSAEYLEPPDAESNYTERLVMLPGLGCCYAPTPETPVELDAARLEIDVDAPLLVCAGTPFKYAPQHDWVLVEIAKRIDRGRLVFFIHDRRHFTKIFRRRLERAFSQHGLRLGDHATFIPWLDVAEFGALLRRSTLMLDTIGFSGFNTAMRAVECDLPIVTREGRFMRGRLASAILKRLSVTDLIADTDQAYVDLAVKLASDTAYRRNVRERIAASRHALYENVEAVRALERFCAEAARAAPEGPNGSGN